jgi:inosine-uridine nucleoside N-ribohydrolase
MIARRRVQYLLCSALACLGGAVQITAQNAAVRPIPVIIDTDIGDDLDDAFAVALALSDPRLEVIGITTAWGDTRTRVLLARRLLAAMERCDVTVAQGPATPDPVPFTQRQWASLESDVSPATDAIEFIRGAVHRRPGEITLIALAPLSNVEALRVRAPEALRQLRQIVLMGGSIHAGYQIGGALPNQTPSAEYNVASTPGAFASLLQSGVPLVLFPLDSTQIKFDEVRRDRLFAHGSPTSDALALLYHQWRLFNSWGQITPTLFDVVPVTWLLEPASCPLTSMRISVDDKGYTRVTDGVANARVCLKSDEAGVQRLIIDALAR